MKRSVVSLVAKCLLLALLSATVARGEAPYNVDWTRQIGTASGDYSLGVAVDGSGNAYISGYTFGSLGGPNAGSYDAFLTKYDSSGSLVWSRQIGTSGVDESGGVAVDGSGNAYISGYTFGSLGGPSAGSWDAFLTKYDPSGSLLWSRQIGTTSSDYSGRVAVDGSGNAYISGYTFGSMGGPNAGTADAFLVKYDGAGNLLWSRQFGTTSYDESHGVAVDAAGNAYVSGASDGGEGPGFLVKYDAAGNLVWSRQIGTTGFVSSTAVAVDAAGNAYISGGIWGSLGGPNAGGADAFLVKYDGEGNDLWSRQIGTSTRDESYGVAVDASGNAYISGVTFGSLGGPNAGFLDAFLVKYDSVGNLLWSRQIGTSDWDYSHGVAVDGSGRAYISGYTPGSLGGPNAGGYDAFLVKYASVPESAGDLDENDFVSAADIDILWRIVRGTDVDPNGDDTGDLNGDTLVNEDDVDYLLANLLTNSLNGRYGDANLSGGGPDLTDYDLWRTGTGGWAGGDFDGSGGVPELNDYNLWRTGPTQFPGSVGQHSGAPGGPLVPEPATIVLMGLALPVLILSARRSGVRRAKSC